ncbi:hypothetical protein BKA93DRAFT_810568 [Sparassis latifolia]
MSAPASAASPLYVDQLTPPVNTAFFIRKEFVLPLKDNIAWQVTAYVFITGANPTEPRFEEKGGVVYVVLVHGGRGTYSSLFPFEQMQFKVKLEGMTPQMQLPPTGSGEPEYNAHGEKMPDTKYTIQFERSMAMFLNGGNEPYMFDAKFEQVFVRHDLGTQTGDVMADGTGTAFSISGFRFKNDTETLEIYGLSVFKRTKPLRELKLLFEYEVFPNAVVSSSRLCACIWHAVT